MDPIAPTEPPSAREREIAAAVALGRQRAAEEEARRSRRQNRKAEEMERAREGVLLAEAKAQEASQRKKEWRKDARARAAEVEADRERRENEVAEARLLAEEQVKERQKRKAYMNELHEAAMRKSEAEKKIYEEKLLKQKLRHDAEEHARVEKEGVERALKQKEEILATELRQKHEAMEREGQKQLYALEQWRRMKRFEAESQMKQALTQVRTVPSAERARREVEAKRNDIIAKKKIDAEYDKRKTQHDSDRRLLALSYEAENRKAKEATEREASQQQDRISRALRQKLDEIGR